MAMEFLLVVIYAGLVNSHLSCLTWEFKGNDLSLICRIQQHVKSVSFIDSNGILQAKCSVIDLGKCKSFHRKGSIHAYPDKYEVVFMITEYDRKLHIKEEWRCSDGNHILKTVVSTSTGIIDDTNIILSGTVAPNLQSVTISCVSCREPHGNIVEFLKDGRSIDLVRYNSVTKKCTHINDECQPNTCSCTPSGNEFTRNFSIVDINKYTSLSCSMQFVDHDKSSRFSKYSTIVLKGKDLIESGSKTIITKAADHGQESNDEKKNMSDARNNRTMSSTDTVKAEAILKWFGISIAFAMPFVVAVVVIFCCRPFKKTKNMGKTNVLMMNKFECSERRDEKETSSLLRTQIEHTETVERINEKETTSALITKKEMSDPITPTISIALYRYLCTNIVGTENHVKRIRLINAIRDNLSSSKNCTVITSGSFGEGLELRGSAVDMMYVHKRLEVCEDGEPRFYQNISVLSMEGDDVKPGYTELRLIQSAHPTDLKCCELHGDRLYYSSTLYKKQFLCNPTLIIHGPFVSDQNGTLDSAYNCFHCKLWISPAVPWITRSRYSWPSDDVKESIIKHGVLFVPIGVKGSPREDIEWRISFSVGEKFLIYTFTHTQLLCYSLLKIILKDVIATYSECKELLCSYFLKTIVFWLSEELPLSVWTPDNIIPCFMRCFNRLIYCVANSVCSHYFIPEYNMFENKIEGRAREILLEKLKTLHSYGWRCILFSDQISFNLNVSMWNIPIEPCILYAIEIRKKLNSNLLKCEDVAVQWADLNTFDNIIYQIISCQQSSIKQTYKLFLSKWCNRHAQIIPLDSTISSNKYQYMQYKACISTLLQNVYHDAVSGWLMVASFFYKRKQYYKALHVIRYSLSKCTLAKLYKDMTISDVHCQLLKLQLFQKKSFCFLLKIMFVDKLQLVANSTLLPDELHMDGSNEIYCIPSAAYCHFLSFLCHYHLHNVRQCQTSLWGLQLVVEQNYLVGHRLYKGAAFNIYGIALQLAGDNESARQAFLKSVKLFSDDPNSALERLLLLMN